MPHYPAPPWLAIVPAGHSVRSSPDHGAREGESFRDRPLGAGRSPAGRRAPTPATGDPGGFSWDGAPPSGDGSLGPAADHPLRVVVPSPKKSSRVW